MAERRICRKVRIKETDFISRRTSYRTIRMNKPRKVGITEVDFFFFFFFFFWIRARNIFQ